MTSQRLQKVSAHGLGFYLATPLNLIRTDKVDDCLVNILLKRRTALKILLPQMVFKSYKENLSLLLHHRIQKIFL